MKTCIRNGGIVLLAVIGFWVGVLGTEGPILNFAFNKQVGTVVPETSGQIIATIEGNPIRQDGSLLFDGVDDRIVLSQPMTAALGKLQAGTIIIRFKYDYVLDRQAIEPLFYYGIASETESDNMFVIEIGHNNPGNTKLYATWVINGRPRLCFDSRVNLKPGEWYEFALVVGPSGNTGYLNGVEMTSRHYNFGRPDMSLFLSSIPVRELAAIGYGKTARLKSPHFLYFKGAIDEVRIYDRPLSGAEIRTMRETVAKASATVEQPTGLVARFRSGQTFLVWDNVPGASGYRIYRSSSPIRSPVDLATAELVGEAAANSSYNARAAQALHQGIYFRIDPGSPPLSPDKGLFVYTPAKTGDFYYAVATVGGSPTITAGENALTTPVHEVPGPVEPVWQGKFTINNHTFDLYVHWTSAHDTPYYPAMSTAESFPFNFAIVEQNDDTSRVHPLIVHLHARGGNFARSLGGTGNPDEWVLSLDDYLPNDIRNSFWYGYHENFDMFTGAGVPTSGVVHGYTVRRVRWTLEWVLHHFPIDRDRVYMMGSSMGGVGSVFLGMAMPDLIAAVYAVVPKFDFSFLHDPNPRNAWNAGGRERSIGDRLWGTVATNLPTDTGIGVYDRLNAGFLAKLWADKSLPPMITFNGKNDTVVGWAEKIPFYRAMEEDHQCGFFFWDSRSHGGRGLAEWQPMQDPKWLYRFRLDQSFIAFSNASCDDNPGDGHADSGATYGTINGYLDWERDTIVDTTDRYEVTIRLVGLKSVYGIVPAPKSATVDVTPRRLQRFSVIPEQAYKFQNITVSGQVIQTGTVVADSLSRITIPDFQVTPAGNRLILTPVG